MVNKPGVSSERTSITAWKNTKVMNMHDLSRDDDFLSHLLVEKLGTATIPLLVHKMDSSRFVPKVRVEELMTIVRRVSSPHLLSRLNSLLNASYVLALSHLCLLRSDDPNKGSAAHRHPRGRHATPIVRVSHLPLPPPLRLALSSPPPFPQHIRRPLVHQVFHSETAQRICHVCILPCRSRPIFHIRRQVAQRAHFPPSLSNRHASRYFELYLPTGSIEIAHTQRYTHRTGKSELCILATRPLAPGTVITELKGSMADLTEQEDQELKSTDRRQPSGGIRRDFSVIHSKQLKKNHLFLGPARFVNVSLVLPFYPYYALLN